MYKIPSRTFLNGITGRPMVLLDFSGGSSILILSHKSSGIFLIDGRCLIGLLGTSVERASQAICLSTIFGIGSKWNDEFVSNEDVISSTSR